MGYLKTIPQSISQRTQSSLLNLVNYHLDQTNIRDPIIIRIEINLTETEIMIGPFKTQGTIPEVILETEIMIGPFKNQETTLEVILEGNIPRIIKTSLPTTLKINNITQETYQNST